MLQEMVVRQRNELIHRARRQLTVRDLIIAAQQELLEAHGLTVGPHIQSLFGRLDTVEEICNMGDNYNGLLEAVDGGENSTENASASSGSRVRDI